jgi:hypothetical protein
MKEFHMILSVLRSTMVIAALGLASTAHADSFTSSASSAGSASVGSISDSFKGSSNSSSGDQRQANGNYHIIDIEQTPGRPGSKRLAMQSDDSPQRITLDVPESVVDRNDLARGAAVNVKNRSYGLAFARSEKGEPFFLALEDAVFNELAARKVSI